jgi:glycolate oxidase iron-sulfur subunit
MGARGRVMLVRALERGELKPSAVLAERLFSCLLCGLCEPLCPVGVDVTGLVYRGLEILGSLDPRGKTVRTMMRKAFMNPRAAFGIGRVAAPVLGGIARAAGIMPFEVKLPKEPLRKGSQTFRPEGRVRGRVGVFVGCAANFIYPGMGRALISALTASGYEAVLPEGEVCCGAPLRAMGMGEDARELAEANLEAFGSLDIEAVLSPCPTCTLMLKKHDPLLVGRGLENATDPAEFLAGRAEGLRPASISGRVMYHEPCHLSSGLGIKDEPMALLERMGIRAERPAHAACCGFGQAGVYPEVSDAQLAIVEKEYRAADTLVTACPACVAQLARRHPRVVHILELAAPRS